MIHNVIKRNHQTLIPIYNPNSIKMPKIFVLDLDTILPSGVQLIRILDLTHTTVNGQEEVSLLIHLFSNLNHLMNQVQLVRNYRRTLGKAPTRQKKCKLYSTLCVLKETCWTVQASETFL
jgi:hypothetical protein